MKLHISDELALPADFITQTAGILAIRGAGKSNLAAVLAEQMFAAKLPFVVIDPTGTWVGLRSAGTGPGLGVVIFGGREQDVPLERGSGETIADFIAENRVSSIVDVSDLSEGDKVRFLADFAKRLYRKNRDPLHLILEEADDYIPQKPFRDQAETLRAFQDIVRRGRARGLGITLITQRSAVVSKDVLTQIETLFVLRTTSPQDRKAIEAWVDYHGQDREIVDSLPSLKPGEAWVWSPHYLGKVERIQVHRRTTLDTAATPKGAAAKNPATKADVDLEAVSQAMRAAIDRAKADDPKELRQQIAALKRELAAKPTAKSEIKTVDVPILKDAQLSRLEASLARLEKIADRAQVEAEQRQQVATNARAAAADIRSAIAQAKTPLPAFRVTPVPRSAQARTTVRTVEPRQPSAAGTGEGSLSRPAQRIVDSLAWWSSAGIQQPTRHQVAFGARYTVNGHFNNMVGELHTAGHVSYPTPGTLQLTDSGEALANRPDSAVSRDELIERVRDVLRGGPAQRIFAALVDAGGPISRADLAAASGYTVNGHFNNVVGSLSTLGVADYPSPGMVSLGSMFEAVN